EVQRQFIDWVAGYTLSAPGSVLRMCLRSTEALSPPKPQLGYRLGGEKPARMTPQRRRVIEAAGDGRLRRPAELAEMAGVTVNVVRGLINAGTLAGEILPPLETFKRPDPRACRVQLSPEQAKAATVLRANVAAHTYSVTLLDGVTGSGKTEVYFEAIAATIERGRQALLLLPEIALTKGFVKRFGQRFGVKPAEWHSGMTGTMRQRVWRGVALGEAKVVVGARSSLFLPFSDLGLIVVDEEHDPAFKQDDGVIYNARDMAVVRAALGKFPVVLSSATPALETMVNVDNGRYQSVQLTRRHAGASFPQMNIIDLKTAGPEPQKWIAPALVEAMAQTLSEGEQVLLFLNRRGYAPLTLCRRCGHRFKCPDCEAWLVEHRFRRQLQCHHCGFHSPRPEECPSCHAQESLVACGPGVERIAEEAAGLFPDARLGILSSDMTPGKTLSTMLDDITGRKVDLIIGTQLAAKGHHFPGLTLVGIIDADIGFGQGDPRAAERTYQILRQVAGRAG
ncbi:MAG TPA: primosomal protein N', partial [Rhizobiales bacterium]|nr:primosomal protein N' [Hyphomicrobiales bacterium]